MRDMLGEFAGSAPTYWLQLPAGTFTGSPLLHLHGLMFSAWPVYFLLQTTFVVRGRVHRHRTWGLLGISLATAMVFVGFAVANDVLVRAWRPGLATGRAPFRASPPNAP